MQSLSNFSRDEGVNGARVEIVIRNVRGTRGTGSPTLTLFELLPTGFLLWRTPSCLWRPFVPSFFKMFLCGHRAEGVVAQEHFKMGLLDCFITEVAQQ